ncbi:MAG: bifunctional UDP-N-acetylmuramoyl-tripeptide:D-alanyl-D-alanine ligase/alanine racemase [Sphingobacteriaceae bacterium]
MNHLLYSTKEIQEAIGAKAFIQQADAAIRTLLTDSRKITDPVYGLFFALQQRRNGHDFIAEVYQAGVRSFVISDPDFDRTRFPEANFFLVKDTLQALQDLAAHHRSKFNYPVVGITGSNGKTIVKEWLSELLSPVYRIVRSPKSYNSQIGVALSVWEMSASHNLAIFEAGISQRGEMEALAKMIKPTIGILTHIGAAHEEGFASREEKISEKLKLFTFAHQLIYPQEVMAGFKGHGLALQQISWGNKNSDLQIRQRSQKGLETSLEATYKNKTYQVHIPFGDEASIANAMTCWATLLALGQEAQVERLALLHPVQMRLELKKGINGCSIIDDSYSCDISSLSIALDFLKQQNQHEKRTLILSDIPESGIPSENLYRQLANLIEQKQVTRLIGIGPELSRFAHFFIENAVFYPSTQDFLKHFPQLAFNEEAVLLKGARAFEFEHISKLLVQKVHETVLEINLNALEHNLNHYKSVLKPGVQLMVMVKAFSYGSGSFEIANLLQFNKVDYLAVAYSDEGVALRQAGITLPIMVMSPDLMSVDTLIANRLEPEIYNFRIFKAFESALKRHRQENYPIHLKLDTGMKRLGFTVGEVPDLIQELKTSELMKVKTVFSHLAAAEDAKEDVFTQSQIDLFKDLSAQLQTALNYPISRHLANTSGISRWPQAQFDMVRLGIGLYGIDKALGENSPLQTVTTLKTSVTQIKDIQPGETIGYNRKGVLPNGGRIATVKIGYADGYNRLLGEGKGKMLINGHLAPTIGSICMDMCMLDVTGIEVNEGDEVIVFGQELKVETIAKALQTIPYEVLTGVSQRVKRIYYYE